MREPNNKLQFCKGIGPKRAALLAKLGLDTLFDILVHLPLRYEDRTTIWPISSLKADQAVSVEGVIQSVIIKPLRKRKLLIVMISDGTGVLRLQWLHFSMHQERQFVIGTKLRCYGLVKHNPPFDYFIIHPETKIIQDGASLLEDNKLYTAVYPTVLGLSQKVLQNLVQDAFTWIEKEAEVLPDKILSQFSLSSFIDAMRAIHYKALGTGTAILPRDHKAYERLIVEEYLVQQISLQQKKQTQYAAWPLSIPTELSKAFLARLPYSLTKAQERVLVEIWQDLNSDQAMLRLLQGDVGSGKTVVAAMALLSALASGAQGALMVPTDLLAEQHVRKLREWFEPLGVKVFFLSGKLSAANKLKIVEDLKNEPSCIIVGTHALFQEKVTFSNLKLVIIDEQHRFGVEQRLALWKKGELGERVPHQLLMTATPIPRTLAMAFSSELAVSVLDELPPGRKPIKTVILENNRRAEVIQRVAGLVQEGRQVYWVCPLIELSEELEAEAAEDLAQTLKQVLPKISIGLIHGRLSAELKEQEMQSFINKNIDILVATTVIEVGVDVPNASLMVIENAERMGLAQLHQLRGRVGRGGFDSFCVLLFQAPLSRDAKSRLAIMRESQDGFLIAEKDLELRGPGEFLGTRQSGSWELKIADFAKDGALLSKAQAMLPHLSEERKKKLVHRWRGDMSECAQA